MNSISSMKEEQKYDDAIYKTILQNTYAILLSKGNTLLLANNLKFLSEVNVLSLLLVVEKLLGTVLDEILLPVNELSIKLSLRSRDTDDSRSTDE